MSKISRFTVALALAAMPLSFASQARAADIGFTFLETEGGGPGTLSVVGLPGAVVIPIGPDVWHVVIAGTGIVALDPGYWGTFHNHVYVDNDPPLVNVIEMLDAATFLVRSDVPLAAVDLSSPGGSFCGTGGPIPLGITCFVGDLNPVDNYFAAWDYAPAAVPEPASLALLGLGLVGLGLSRRKRAG